MFHVKRHRLAIGVFQRHHARAIAPSITRAPSVTRETWPARGVPSPRVADTHILLIDAVRPTPLKVDYARPDPPAFSRIHAIWVGFSFHVKRSTAPSGIRPQIQGPRPRGSLSFIGTNGGLAGPHGPSPTGIASTRAPRPVTRPDRPRVAANSVFGARGLAHFISGPVDNRSVRTTRHGPCPRTVPTVRLDSRVENVRAQSTSDRETVGESGMDRVEDAGCPPQASSARTRTADRHHTRELDGIARDFIEYRHAIRAEPAEDPVQWSPEARTSPPPEVPPSSVGVPGTTEAPTPVSGEQRIPWDALLMPPPTDGPGSSSPERSVGTPSAVVEPERSAWSPTDEHVVEDPRSIDDGPFAPIRFSRSPRPLQRPSPRRPPPRQPRRVRPRCPPPQRCPRRQWAPLRPRRPRRPSLPTSTTRPSRSPQARRAPSAGPPECHRAATDDRRLRLGCRDRRRADR